MTSRIIRYWAAAKEAAGTAEEAVEGETLEAVLKSVRAKRSGDDRLSRVLERSSFLVNGDPVGKRPHAEVEVAQGSVIEVLPPFAGG